MAHHRRSYGSGLGELYVDVGRSQTGDLTITGQHLWPGGEYEYAIAVNVNQLPLFVEALGGEHGDDPWTVATTHLAKLVEHGERVWLQEHGVESTLWTHVEYD